MAKERVRLDGMDVLLKNLDVGKLLPGPAYRALDRVGYAVEEKAKGLAPVNYGRLRASIGHQISEGRIPDWVRIGTNVHYAPYMHFGRKVPSKMPPLAPLKLWAKRHGMPESAAWPIAKKIAERGYKDHPDGWQYIVKGVEESDGKIRQIVSKMADEIAEEWGR